MNLIKTHLSAGSALPGHELPTGRQLGQILEQVRVALETGNCLLAYQPVMRNDMPGEPGFLEALIRVRDERGEILPSRLFMDAATNTALGRDIDAMALRLALDALSAHPDQRVAVNVSARSIGDYKWQDVLSTALKLDDTLAERLILEIDEASAMELCDVVQRFMEEMQPQGIAFALDHFGTGHTAFRDLRTMRFDMVKMDGTLIRNIDRDPDAQAVTKALLSIARHFDMLSCAVGVETDEEAGYLEEIGIDCQQGFAMGAPRLSIRPAKLALDAIPA